MVWGNIKVATRRHIQKLMQMSFASPNNISHAGRDESHILRKKPTHGADQAADKRPQPGLKHGKRWF